MSRDGLGSKRKRKHTHTQTGPRKRRAPRHNAAVSDIEYLENGIAEDAVENHRDIDKLLRMIDFSDPGARVNVQAGVTLCKVFSRLIASGSLTRDGLGTTLSPQIHDWYHQKYHFFRDSMVKLLRSVPVAQRVHVIHLCWKVLEQDAELWENSVWASESIFRGLVTAVAELSDGKDIREIFTIEYINQCHDCCYHSLGLFPSLVASNEDEGIVENVTEILSFLDAPPNSPEELNFLTIPSTKASKRPVVTPASLRRQAENAWLSILRSPSLSTSLRKSLLRVASTKILPWMSRPETLMDFLTDSYNVGGSTSLLALSGLFDLISRKNLDYPSFYPKLYSLIDADLLQSKHRSRFLRLLDTFLQSPRLPASLVAAFIKRLARRTLFAPPAAIVAIIPYIYNLLKSHPTCTFMIHRSPHPLPSKSSTSETGPIGQDPFNIHEPDPQNTANNCALDSSLWELETLQSHYHPNVASLAKIISQQFTKQRYSIEDFLDHGYGSMLDSELSATKEAGHANVETEKKQPMKKEKKAPVVEWRIPNRIFTTEKPYGKTLGGVAENGDDKEGDQEGLILRLWQF